MRAARPVEQLLGARAQGARASEASLQCAASPSSPAAFLKEPVGVRTARPGLRKKSAAEAETQAPPGRESPADGAPLGQFHLPSL